MDFEALRVRIDQALVAALHPSQPLDSLFLEIAETLYDEAAVPRPKRLRPILAVIGARLAGSAEDEAFDIALALEQIHDYSVVLDDFMDDDRLRRSRPTTWVQFGASPAITAGCGLYTLAFRRCIRWIGKAASHAEAVRRTRAIDRLVAAAIELHDAQLADLSAEDSLSISLDKVLEMARGRSVLVGSALAIGADAAGGHPDLVEALQRVAPTLACAYSLIDDARSFVAVDAAAGKAPGGDIRQRKKTYPIVVALQQLGASERAGVAEIWERPGPLTDNAVAAINRILLRTEAVEATESLVGALLDQIKAELHLLEQGSPEIVRSLLGLLDAHFRPASTATPASIGRRRELR
jgi:geranylgeranyl diphosphate synthase type I